jgi:hypothetical protein
MFGSDPAQVHTTYMLNVCSGQQPTVSASTGSNLWQAGGKGRGFLVRNQADGGYDFDLQLGAVHALRSPHSNAFVDFDGDCLAGVRRCSVWPCRAVFSHLMRCQFGCFGLLDTCMALRFNGVSMLDLAIALRRHFVPSPQIYSSLLLMGVRYMGSYGGTARLALAPCIRRWASRRKSAAPTWGSLRSRIWVCFL